MKRWWAAIANSWNGLSACARSEAAFREEIVLLVIAIPGAMVLASDPWKRALLLSPIVLLLVVELLNTAIEKLCDRITGEFDPAIGRIKDMGSAAIGVTLIATAAMWVFAVVDYMRM
jgi:diacylglycerol kinase (ATP)